MTIEHSMLGSRRMQELLDRLVKYSGSDSSRLSELLVSRARERENHASSCLRCSD
jgi:hypothetical protein